MENMKEKVRTYFEHEYNRLVALLEKNPEWLQKNRKEAVWNTIQRCLGVAEFVGGVEEEYEEIREMLWKLY
jgi:hypothetical protein